MTKKLSGKKILFVFHNSGLTGASLVLLRYIQFLHAQKKYKLVLLLPGKGKMESALQGMGELFIYGAPVVVEPLLSRGLKKLGLKKRDTKQNPDRVLEIVLKTNPDLVYCNTIVCAEMVKRIKHATKIPVLWHIHELELGVKLTGVDPSGIITAVDRVIANSETTAAFLTSRFVVDKNKIRIHYPVLPANNVVKRKKSNDKFVIGSSGTALSHKGALLFVRLAGAINRKHPQNNFLFKWVGNHKTLKQELEHDIHNSGLDGKVIFTGELENPFEAYSEFDFFVSLSKEESFGLACMEVAAIGIPVGGFEGTGGIEELLRKCDGLLVPFLDVEKMADSIVALSRNEKQLAEMADRAAAFSKNFLPEKIIPGWIESIDEVLTENKTA